MDRQLSAKIMIPKLFQNLLLSQCILPRITLGLVLQLRLLGFKTLKGVDHHLSCQQLKNFLETQLLLQGKFFQFAVYANN